MATKRRAGRTPGAAAPGPTAAEGTNVPLGTLARCVAAVGAEFHGAASGRRRDRRADRAVTPKPNGRQVADSELGRIAEIDRFADTTEQYGSRGVTLELVDVEIRAPRWEAPARTRCSTTSMGGEGSSGQAAHCSGRSAAIAWSVSRSRRQHHPCGHIG